MQTCRSLNILSTVTRPIIPHVDNSLTMMGCPEILSLCRTNIPDWARQPQHESSIPGWINVVVALAAIIPILYLLFRDTKVKAFLKPTEFQELPLEHKEVNTHPFILISK